MSIQDLRVLNESIQPEKLYHISEHILDREMTPEIPMSKYEEQKTPRICFARTIQGCLIGMNENKNIDGKIFHVYSIETNDFYEPNTNEVSDVNITGEVWYLKPITPKYEYDIKITGIKEQKSAKINNKNFKVPVWEYKIIKNNLKEDVSDLLLSEQYDPPYNAEQIKKNYGNELYNKLKSDPVHEWRMKSGIELIHKEPTKEELERIWKNWQLMSYAQKEISDNKSIELFGIDNKTNYEKLIKSYKTDNLKEDVSDLLLDDEVLPLTEGLKQIFTHAKNRVKMHNDPEVQSSLFTKTSKTFAKLEDNILDNNNLSNEEKDNLLKNLYKKYGESSKPIIPKKKTLNVNDDDLNKIVNLSHSDNYKNVETVKDTKTGNSITFAHANSDGLLSDSNKIIGNKLVSCRPSALPKEMKKKSLIKSGYYSTGITKVKHNKDGSNKVTISNKLTENVSSDYSDLLLDESLVFSHENFEHNLDKWGSNPILTVIGVPGSGKTTLAKRMSEENECPFLETDVFSAIIKRPERTIQRLKTESFGYGWLNDLTLRYYEENKKTFDDYSANLDWNASFTEIGKYLHNAINTILHDFVPYVEKNAPKGQKGILEGAWFVDFEPEFFEDRPLIIRGTSALTSLFRQIKRTMNDGHRKDGKKTPLKEKLGQTWKIVKTFYMKINQDKMLEDLKKELSESPSLNERLEVLVTRPKDYFNKELHLYRCQQDKVDVVKTTFLNNGTKLSPARASSFWSDNKITTLKYALPSLRKTFGEIDIDGKQRPKGLLFKNKFYIYLEKDETEKDIINKLKKHKYEQPFYLYEITIKGSDPDLGIGHNNAIKEFTLDRDIVPEKVTEIKSIPDEIIDTIQFIKNFEEYKELYKEYSDDKLTSYYGISGFENLLKHHYATPLPHKDILKTDFFKNEFIDYVNSGKDFVLVGDAHIGLHKSYEEALLDAKDYGKKLNKFIQDHNLKFSDYLLILGDFVDRDDKKEEIELIKTIVAELPNRFHFGYILGNNEDSLNAKNIINNMPNHHEIHFVDYAIETDKYIFSHTPYIKDLNGKINIHAHLHGRNKYFYIDENDVEKYIDIWEIGNHGEPVMLSDILKKYEKHDINKIAIPNPTTKIGNPVKKLYKKMALAEDYSDLLLESYKDSLIESVHAGTTTIYFVRHGKTGWNALSPEDKRKTLEAKISRDQMEPVSDEGMVKVRETAKELKDVNFDICLCSPYVRTKQTCAEILKYHKDITPIYDDSIAEIDFRERLTDKERNYLDDLGWPKEPKRSYFSWLPDEGRRLYKSINDEAKKVIENIKNKYPGKTVLVVSHGVRIRSLMLNCDNIKYNSTMATSIDIPNACIITRNLKEDYSDLLLESQLENYLTKKILPKYSNPIIDDGHRSDHINSVLNKSLELGKEFNLSDRELEMLYTAAIMHDIGLLDGDRDNHNINSGKYIRNDKFLKSYFTEEELETIAQAAEDHRASLKYEPRSIYGKIISTADRDISPEMVMERMIKFRLKRGYDDYDSIYKSCREHYMDKFSSHGYMKMPIVGKQTKKDLDKIRSLENEKIFKKYFDETYDKLCL